MKKRILSVLAFAIIGTGAMAQNIRLNAYSSYVFDNDFTSDYINGSSTYFTGTIKGGYQYGAGLEFMPRPDVGTEMIYLGQQATVPIRLYNYYGSGGNQNEVLDMSINYMMLGGRRYMRKPGSKVEGYGGLMAGVVWAKTEGSTSYLGSVQTINSTVTKFAWGARLGLNIWASEKVGINMQAMLLSAPQGYSGGVYFGTGGSGATVTTYSTLYQFSLGGGLTFALGK
jgi:hypothetical protein